MKNYRIARALGRAGTPQAKDGRPGWVIRYYWGQVEVCWDSAATGLYNRAETMALHRRREEALERIQSALVAKGLLAEPRKGFVSFDALGTVAISVK